MEAYEFKNYILGMIFYYYLSDKTEKYMVNLLKDDGIGYEEAWADPEYKEAVVEEALRDLGFVIEPQFLFRKMVKMVENRSFDIEFLQKAINSLMESTIGNDSQEILTACSRICSLILQNLDIPSRTEAQLCPKSFHLLMKSILVWKIRRLMSSAMRMSI